jgi:chitodextrinase
MILAGRPVDPEDERQNRAIGRVEMHRVGRFVRQVGLVMGALCLSLAGTAVVGASPAEATTPPAAARNLRVVDVSDTTVTLDWDPSPTPDVHEYQVLANGAEATWATTADMVVYHLDPDTTYTFTVRAVLRPPSGDIVTGPPSNAVIATTERDVTPPNPPRLHLGIRTQTSISLSWFGHGDNDTVGPLTYLLSTPDGILPYTGQWEDRFDNLTPGTTYSFSVRARDRSGNISEPSNVVTVTMDATPPSPPLGLTFNPGTRILSWQPATDDVDPPSQLTYRVYANGQPVHLVFEPRTGTSVDLGLEIDCGNPVPNGTYTVTATDVTGNESAPSSPVEVQL